MNRATGEFHTRFNGAFMGMEPLESGQERRVNVELPVPPRFNEPFRQQPHETGAADQIDLGFA